MRPFGCAAALLLLAPSSACGAFLVLTADDAGSGTPGDAGAHVVRDGGAVLDDGGAVLDDGGAGLDDGGAVLDDGGAGLDDGGEPADDAGVAAPPCGNPSALAGTLAVAGEHERWWVTSENLSVAVVIDAPGVLRFDRTDGLGGWSSVRSLAFMRLVDDEVSVRLAAGPGDATALFRLARSEAEYVEIAVSPTNYVRVAVSGTAVASAVASSPLRFTIEERGGVTRIMVDAGDEPIMPPYELATPAFFDEVQLIFMAGNDLPAIAATDVVYDQLFAGQSPAPFCPTSSLVDDFDGTSSARWQTSAGCQAETVEGILRVSSDVGAPTCEHRTAMPFALDALAVKALGMSKLENAARAALRFYDGSGAELAFSVTEDASTWQTSSGPNSSTTGVATAAQAARAGDEALLSLTFAWGQLDAGQFPLPLPVGYVSLQYTFDNPSGGELGSVDAINVP